MNKLILTTATLLLSLPLQAQQWPTPRPEAKAGARWWWMGSAVNEQDLRWNIGEYASHGIGALEITPIYGVKGNSSNNIDFLSPKYMEMLKVTADACKQNGIELGMTTGTGWPFGGPWVPLEETASQMVIVDTIVNGCRVNFEDRYYHLGRALHRMRSAILLQDMPLATAHSSDWARACLPMAFSTQSCPARHHGAS